MRRVSGSPSHPKRFVILLVALIVASAVSFLYLAWVMEGNNSIDVATATTNDSNNDAPQEYQVLHKRQNETKHHFQQPKTTTDTSSLTKKQDDANIRNSKRAPTRRSTFSTWSQHSRILVLLMDTTQAIKQQLSQQNQQFQYHRVQPPKEKIPPHRDYETLMTKKMDNRTWDDFLDLPVLLMDDHDEKDHPNAGLNTSEVPILNASQPSTHGDENENTCRPMADWMTASFVNCNSMHEIDLVGSVSQHDQSDLVLLGEGWFRSTWKYSNNMMVTQEDHPSSSTVVVKTLRIEREFVEEYFDLHRRDAVAMERLTFSPFVMDVYGYCGQSAINELAGGVANGEITSLEKLNRRLRGKETDPRALDMKLQLASIVALGLAHIHNIHVSNKPGTSKLYSTKQLLYGNHTATSTTGFGNSIPTMAHYDINPRNIAIMSDGKPKLNDFNIAEFLTYNPSTNQSCGFRSRLHEPWWRAPEEMDMSHNVIVTEKVDVYALGNVLFHILTTHAPRGKMKKERMEEVRQKVRDGIPPAMLEPYATGSMSKNRIVKAFIKAMDLCFQADPSKRGTAIQVARIFHKASKEREKEKERRPKEEKKKKKEK
ncbi:protein kinase domain containing protein [Nitzschia inconspicua]|uniref:Protein kinase domain containing protein n=1 Tax=Nitzschia inconspicua TaxID=303405 RepID=A0A9K3KX41_9STRA|nr:protein kinase domain containing protein [Nitzschia inconspicua]